MTEKRRKIIHLPRSTETKVAVIANDTQTLMEDAKSIIASELAHYRSKVSRGSNLDLREARVIQGYLDSLTKLQKEEREQARQEDLSQMSNEELLQLAEEVFGKTRPKAITPEGEE